MFNYTQYIIQHKIGTTVVEPMNRVIIDEVSYNGVVEKARVLGLSVSIKETIIEASHG